MIRTFGDACYIYTDVAIYHFGEAINYKERYAAVLGQRCVFIINL